MADPVYDNVVPLLKSNCETSSFIFVLLSFLLPKMPTPILWAPSSERLWGTCCSCILSEYTETQAWEQWGGCEPSWAPQSAPHWQSSHCSIPGWGSTRSQWMEKNPECREITRELLPRAEIQGYGPGHNPGDKPPACTWPGSGSAYQPHQPWSSAWNKTGWVEQIVKAVRPVVITQQTQPSWLRRIISIFRISFSLIIFTFTLSFHKIELTVHMY